MKKHPSLLLVQPTSLLEDGGLFKTSRRWLVGITMPYLAALTPPGWQVRIVDERLQDVPFDEPWDLVAVSFMSHHAPNAFRIADRFRAMGVPVVAGGFHASAMPEHTLAHFDAVVVGEAELTWPQLLEDVEARSLKSIYRAEVLSDLTGLPAPRFDLIDMHRYSLPAVEHFMPMQTSRGCPFDCRFCEVTRFYGKTYRFRPVGEVIREIEKLGYKSIYFVDDNIAANRKRVEELLTAVKPKKIRWTGQVNMFTGKDEALLDLMAESGCLHLNIGMESISRAGLAEMNKRMNQVEDYRVVLRNLRDHGIFFSINIVLGLDSDTLQTFEDTVAFLRQEKVPVCFLWILTPRVGTAIREDLSKQGRLFPDDWSRHDGSHCVFEPASLTPDELEEAFWRAYATFYSTASIVQRLIPTFLSRKEWLIALAFNLNFAIGVRRRRIPVTYY